MPYSSGRQLLQLPGPTNVPERVLRAMHRPLIDHRGPEFRAMMRGIFAGLERIFGASAGVMIFPSSATGCWEAGLVNTLEPGDAVLVYDNGFFARKWGATASRLGLEVAAIEGDWRRPIDPARISARLEGEGAEVRAVLVVHNETSTGVTSDVAAVRSALDAAGHDALLMVDTVSSLGATAFRHDEWGVDVTVCGSQKGLMLPPGLAFCAVSDKALEESRESPTPRAYWDWGDMLEYNRDGVFPSTPPTGLLFGLEAALAMLEEEGLDAVFARHARFARATRRAADAWGLENFCVDPEAFSNAGTTLVMPGEAGGDAMRTICRERFDLVLGGGLGPLADRVFRIGHLGDLNELMLAGALAGVEMALSVSEARFEPGGLQAALEILGEPSEGAST